MQFRRSSISLSVVAALSALAAGQDGLPTATSEQGPARAASTDVPNPMASFARMLPGEWRVTYRSGTSSYDTWHWGPGQHSMRVLTDGLDAAGNPMRGLNVVYWHPGRQQICTLGLEGLQEGTIRFDGERAEGVTDLFQNGGIRRIRSRWVFDGPDKYRDTILEMVAGKGLEPTNGWDYVRSQTLTEAAPRTDEEPPELTARPKFLGPFLGHSWKAKGRWATGELFHVQATVAWIPYAEGIYAHASALEENGAGTHLLDAYIYVHRPTNALRCLALSNTGSVYAGKVIALESAGVQLEVDGDDGERVTSHVVRFDLAPDGTVRDRVWSLEGTERTLFLDAQFDPAAPKSD